MLDRFFFISLVLNATGLFRFLAPQLGVSIGQVSTMLLVFNLVYVVCRLPYLVPMFSKLCPWFVFLVVWPLATLIYGPTTELREIGLVLYGFALFAGTVAYTTSNGLLAIRRVFLISLILTVFGQVLNMAMPMYFESVATLANARALSLGRPGGFFMQPNALAVGLSLLFIGWFSMAKRNTVFWEPIIILVFWGCELLTGSRTGMVLALGIVVLHLRYQWCRKKFRFVKEGNLSIRMAVLVACISFGVIAGRFSIDIYGHNVERCPGDLIDRMNTLLEFSLTDDETLVQDSSLVDRFGAQITYLNLIKEKPFIGHGFGTEALSLGKGGLNLSSHSTMLSVVMEYGVFYLLIFFLLLASIFLNRHRGAVERALGTNTVVQFVMITLVTFVGSGGLFDRRVFFIVFGMVCTAIYYPSRIFAFDVSTRAYTRVLSRAEVRQVGRNRKQYSVTELPMVRN